jgi:hypothetical protein
MNFRNSEFARTSSRGRLLATAIGGGAIVVMGTFAVSHNVTQPGSGRIVSDSGHESPFPTATVPAPTGMSLGATTSSVAPGPSKAGG